MATLNRARDILADIKERLASGELDQAEAEALLLRLSMIHREVAADQWEPYPWQIPPAHVETHGAWLMLGGRGTGKTEGAARYFDDHANSPPCDPRIPGGHRMAIIAPTLGDAADACFYGPSGLHTINPATRLKGGAGGTHVHWPNKVQARIFGCYSAEDVERLRAGGNRCLIWFEEVAAQRLLGKALEHTGLGLRVGKNPHYVMSTTPKPRPELKALVADPKVYITKGTTKEATHLDPTVRAELELRWAGTRTGRQELDAEILDDVEGAMWKQNTIDVTRFAAWAPDSPWQLLAAECTPPVRALLNLGPWAPQKAERRKWETWVAVDPPGETAECGIIIGAAPERARANHDHAVILGDYTITGPPEEWGPRVVQAFRDFNARGVVVEKNQGGDMTRSTIHAVDSSVPVEKITAIGSKADRAEPVSVLYSRGWVHHIGILPGLENQLTTWVEDISPSPDRLDALVHLVTKLLSLRPGGRARVGNPLTGRAA